MINFKASILCFFTILLFCASQAQSPKVYSGAYNPSIDSLLLVLNTVQADTNRIKTTISLCGQFALIGNYEKAMQYIQEAMLQSKKINYKKGIANSYNNIGVIYFYKGDYLKATDNYINALKIRQEIGDLKGVAASYTNIGTIYNFQGQTNKVLENYLKAVEIFEKIGDKKGLAATYNNLGVIYKEMQNYEKALLIFSKSLKFSEALGDIQSISAVYGNIGTINFAQKNYEEALKNQFKALQYSTKIGDKQAIALAKVNIGRSYSEQNKLLEAYNTVNEALAISKEIDDKDGLSETYLFLAELFEKQGDFKKALQYHTLYSNSKDTLLNVQSSNQILEMNTKYESEKKDKELTQKDTEISKQQAETEKKNLQRNIFILGFVLVLLLSFYIFRGYRKKKSANLLLEEKNMLIEIQKKLVEDKNKKITDSINYAKRIQQAILPSNKIIQAGIPDFFIFFKPKNIVSGDFYWMHIINPQQILFAVVDCTGHGVPGALMSMMGYNLLEQIVKEHNVLEPAMILDELSKLVVESLNQSAGAYAIKDGMDLSIYKINYEFNELEYAGAHNSLYLIRNGLLTEIKADKRSVGVTAKHSLFTNNKLNVKKGDCLYMFSDGYADQKGGPNNKKFFYQPFRELLIKINNQPMVDQRVSLENVMTEWIGENEQIDDMLIVGVRI